MNLLMTALSLLLSFGQASNSISETKDNAILFALQETSQFRIFRKIINDNISI